MDCIRLWTVGLLCTALAILSGCDVPTGNTDPSLNTETNISGPLVSQTYSFLGGPESENDVIIDTTSNAAKALGTSIERVSAAPKGGPQSKLSVNQGFSEVLVEKSDDIATQDIDVDLDFVVSAPVGGGTVKAKENNVNVQDGSENNNFGAIDVSEGPLDLVVENNTGTELQDVRVKLENEDDAASDFDGENIPDLAIDEDLGTIAAGGTGSVSVTAWESPDRAIKEKIAITIEATASSGFPPGNVKVCLGGCDTSSELTAQTLYFRPEGETLSLEGTVDVLDPGRVEFGSASYVDLKNPRIDIEGLDLRGPHAEPKAKFEAFEFSYPDDITFVTGPEKGESLSVDLVADSDFDGTARSCPCNPTVDLDETIRFDGLQANEDIEFEVDATLEDNPSATAILSVGDEVRADEAGLPIAETFRVNWDLTDNSNDDVTVRDTLDTDFSGLEDLTDPDNDATLDDATLTFRYTNKLPLGADLTLTVVDETGTEIRALSDGDDTTPIELDAAPKNSDGTAAGPSEDQIGISLDRAALSELADGRRLRVKLEMRQEQDGTNARIKAKDTLDFGLLFDVNGTVNTGS
ncbi:MAG: hypothetical protein BRD55_02380 [Bacteroidetes bacterium SW_9_63_38]|nr:MAG: hypothetical protein BRD55_02380 [Bacteroidetes bacterium SW_9_63_38]